MSAVDLNSDCIFSDFYERVVALKKRGVKVSIGLGGWNDSAGDKYSRLVNNPAKRRKFIFNVLDFMQKYGFDGLDVDWEYPKCWQVIFLLFFYTNKLILIIYYLIVKI